LVEKPLDVWRVVTGKRAPQSDWALANSRFNTIVFASLRCKITGVEFGVANYHMPCMFRNPKVMTIHAQLAGMYAQRLAGDLPAVLVVGMTAAALPRLGPVTINDTLQTCFLLFGGGGKCGLSSVMLSQFSVRIAWPVHD
jgi:hypothetical protein